VPPVPMPTTTEAPQPIRTYFVDNSALHAESPGLGLRASKSLHDTGGLSEFARWGTSIRGRESSDGWLEVQGRFLPMSIDGMRVIVRMVVAYLSVECRSDYACGAEDLQRLSADLRDVLASAAGGGCTADRVVIDAPASPDVDGTMLVTALIAPGAGHTSGELDKWLDGDGAACAAVFDRFAVGAYRLKLCRIGEDGEPFDVTRAVAQLGPIDVHQYMALLGGHGADIGVQMIVQRVSVSELSADGVRLLQSEIVKSLAGAVGAQPGDVQDVDDHPNSVTVVHGGTSHGAVLLINCHIALTFGQTVSAAAAVLTGDDSREQLAKVLRAMPEIRAITQGSSLTAADIRLGVAQSSDDAFFVADANLDNRLDAMEFEHIARSKMRPPLPVDEARAVFKALDSDGSHDLTDEEFFAVSQIEATA